MSEHRTVQLIILSPKLGDDRREFDPDDSQQLEEAEKTFRQKLEEGFAAFKMVGKDRKEGEQVFSLKEALKDPLAKAIMFIPGIVGG